MRFGRALEGGKHNDVVEFNKYPVRHDKQFVLLPQTEGFSIKRTTGSTIIIIGFSTLHKNKGDLASLVHLLRHSEWIEGDIVDHA